MMEEQQVLIKDHAYDGPFGVAPKTLNALFETDAVLSGKSKDMLNALGGIDQLYIDLRTSKDGINDLDPELQARRIELFGDNKVRPPKLKNFFLFMYKQTQDFCIRILALASVLMFLLATVSNDPFESIVQALSILLAILAVVIIGAITDYRKEKQFIALYMEQEEEDKKYFTLIREGRRHALTPHSDLLVGDLVDIQPGDALTFDGIMIRGSAYVDVDESMITGLTHTLKKRPFHPQDAERASQGSRKSVEQETNDCFLRAGSNIFEGSGTLLICAVGDNTYSNRQKTAQNSNDHEEHGDDQSPLQKSTTMLAKYLVFIGCMSATFMFVILELYMVREIHELQEKIFTGRTLRKVLSDFIDAFLIIVLSIPEGLPLIVTLSLAFSINQLKKQGIIVRNLHVAQVLGGMDVICFDKTGTLTKNNVVLSHIYADRFVHTSLDTDSDPLNANWPIFRALSEAVLANNTAKFASDKGSQSGSQISVSRAHFQAEDVKWMGNRMDCAMMEFLDRKLKRDLVCEYWDTIFKQTYKIVGMSESKNNFTAAVVREKGDRSRIYIKGRPAEVLQRCSDMVVKQAKDGEFRDLALFEPGSEYYPQAVLKEPIDLTVREDIQNVVRTFGEQSLKTLAFAFRDIQVNDQQNFDWDQQIFDSNEYTWICMTGLRDEIRPDARETMQVLQEACIDVKMITGDARITSVNVGRFLMMVSPEEAQLEILRKSEILQKSVLRHAEGSKEESESADPFKLGSNLYQSQHIINTTDQVKSPRDKDPINKLLQDNINISTKKQPVVLNFQEYLIKVRQILKASEKFYQHTVITDSNCTQLISEIKEDRWALEKIIELNKEISIVADASQEQKQNFLRMLIGINECTIGYVGDGNNDARSLKTSHVGFAPGTTATNVAKECSGVILMNDKLLGMGPCIKWGRNIFLNIKRFIYFQLSFYFTSITVMLIATIAFHQQPFSVLQVIWLALVQDIFSAISLSTERPQKTVLAITRPFRTGENLIDQYLIKLIACQFVYQGVVTIVMLFYTPFFFGVEPSQLHQINEIGAEFEPAFAVHFTIIYHLTAMFQIVNLINARRIGPYEYNTLEDVCANRPFIYMIVLLFAVQQVIIYEGGKYFKTAPLTVTQNLVCCLLALGSLVAFWVSKNLFSSHYLRKRQQ